MFYRYECKIRISIQKCECIPWEFAYPIQNVPECDIFGRTCFYNSIDTLAHNIKNDCPQCWPICGFTNYYKEVKEMKSLITDQYNSGYYKNEYFNVFDNTCYGNKGICNYLLNNDTYFDHTWYNYTSALGLSSFVQRANYKFSDLIIVHLEYVSPEVPTKILDARMSLYDCIAALGGTFGIFTQLTGCSLITLLHLIVLFAKALYNKYQY